MNPQPHRHIHRHHRPPSPPCPVRGVIKSSRKWVAAPTAAAGRCSLANAFHDATKDPRKSSGESSDWQHCTPLERMYAVRQGYAEQDGVGRRRRRRMQLLEAAGSIKPDGLQVSGTYREVGAVRAHFLDR